VSTIEELLGKKSSGSGLNVTCILSSVWPLLGLRPVFGKTYFVCPESLIDVLLTIIKLGKSFGADKKYKKYKA
jgi:hypothetical protein